MATGLIPMSDRRPGLSKSKLMAFAQCPKRLFHQTYHPEEGEVSDQTETAFETGHQVGDLAIELYGGGESRFVSNDDGLEIALEQTREYMAKEPRVPLFEATFEFDGVLVRVVRVFSGHLVVDRRVGGRWQRPAVTPLNPP